VSWLGYLLIAVCVLASNISSLLQIEILRISDLILYTPLSGALNLLAAEVVAVFIAKEKPQILATILAVSSVLVVLLPNIIDVVLEVYQRLML
jgi:trehalose-6-phosphate synthase